LFLFGGFFVDSDLAGLNLHPVAAGYSLAENQLILFCQSVAYAKIELSPAESSGNQGCQLRGFFPLNANLGILKACGE
jgi:hypothetical protein